MSDQVALKAGEDISRVGVQRPGRVRVLETMWQRLGIAQAILDVAAGRRSPPGRSSGAVRSGGEPGAGAVLEAERRPLGARQAPRQQFAAQPEHDIVGSDRRDFPGPVRAQPRYRRVPGHHPGRQSAHQPRAGVHGHAQYHGTYPLRNRDPTLWAARSIGAYTPFCGFNS